MSKKSQITILDEGGTDIVVSLEKVREILQKFSDDMHDYNHKLEKQRLGKVLTIIDGIAADETQRKAIKDLVHDVWYGSRNSIEGHYNGFPQLRHATEAIGFELWEQLGHPEPVNEDYNPYKKLAE